jgi:hypothetical protein
MRSCNYPCDQHVHQFVGDLCGTRRAAPERTALANAYEASVIEPESLTTATPPATVAVPE